MGSPAEELQHGPILLLGQCLAVAASKPARTTREIAALRELVAPGMVSLRRVVNQTGISTLFGCLQKLLDLNVPANLVKLMTLTLRAIYPMAQPPEDLKELCGVMSAMWALAAELFGELVLVCNKYPDENGYELCKTVMDQLQPLTSDGDPGDTYTSEDLLQSTVHQYMISEHHSDCHSFLLNK